MYVCVYEYWYLNCWPKGLVKCPIDRWNKKNTKIFEWIENWCFFRNSILHNILPVFFVVVILWIIVHKSKLFLWWCGVIKYDKLLWRHMMWISYTGLMLIERFPHTIHIRITSDTDLQPRNINSKNVLIQLTWWIVLGTKNRYIVLIVW